MKHRDREPTSSEYNLYSEMVLSWTTVEKIFKRKNPSI